MGDEDCPSPTQQKVQSIMKLIDKAKDLLEKRLSKGPARVRDLISEGLVLGLNYDVLNRARLKLEYETVQAGFGDRPHVWFNPNKIMSGTDRKIWYEENSTWIPEYSNFFEFNIDGRVNWKSDEFFNQWKKDLYEEIVINGDQNIGYRDHKKNTTIENHYSALIEGLKSSAQEDDIRRVEELQRHLEWYKKNKQLMSEGVKPQYHHLPIDATDKWLLSRLKSGPCERKTLVEEASISGIDEVSLEVSRIKLRLEVIESLPGNIWWSDLDRHIAFKKTSVKKETWSAYTYGATHREWYSHYFGHYFNGESQTYDDDGDYEVSPSRTPNSISFSQFYKEDLAEKSKKSTLTEEEFETLKAEWDERLKKEVYKPKLEYNDNNKNVPSKYGKHYDTWSKI